MNTTTFKTNRRLVTVVHFNRIAMQRGDTHVWTVHNHLGCFNVREVRIQTPMNSIFDPDGRQPRAKFKGLAMVEIKNGIATLR
jgi:hypothetical protein